MGLGAPVPPGPPRVSASMKPRTTVLRRAVPNSSRVYLPDTRRGRGERRLLTGHPASPATSAASQTADAS